MIETLLVEMAEEASVQIINKLRLLISLLKYLFNFVIGVEVFYLLL